MTVEERAKKTCDAFIHVGYMKALTKAFTELIEECAKIADEFLTSGDRHAAQLIGNNIRALAGPKEEVNHAD